MEGRQPGQKPGAGTEAETGGAKLTGSVCLYTSVPHWAGHSHSNHYSKKKSNPMEAVP